MEQFFSRVVVGVLVRSVDSYDKGWVSKDDSMTRA